MTPDQYVESVLAKYAVPRGSTSPAERLGATVAGPLRAWAGQQLDGLQYSGSYAKETGVRGISDVDVFISLKSETTGTLKEIYEKLVSLARSNGWSPRKQNVSVGVTINGTLGDLVPGKIQAGYQNYHSLYLQKRDSWTQTNVALHVDTVRNSRRLKEIRAIKIWRMLKGLEFPSLYALGPLVLDTRRERASCTEDRRLVPRIRAYRGPRQLEQRPVGRPDAG
jgi:hypothetical protein